MFWADTLAKEISKSKTSQYVNDAKTPSGRVHVGSLRGVIIHDLIHKVLKEQKIPSKFTYIYDDMDPMDGLPVYLSREKYEKYMGMPLKDIPAPTLDQKNKYEGQIKQQTSFAIYFADEFTSVFNKLGATPEILWTSKIYKDGKLDKQIKQALDNAEKIQEIYEKISGSRRPKDFLPFQPICEKCGKIGTTISTAWDGLKVSYTCAREKVTWAKGCDFAGSISPFGGSGKMPFRVEWPAKWASLGITIEGAGKDHTSKGGTRDTAVEICREIFEVDPPENISYEHFLYGGKKMSSSKGIGTSANEAVEVLPPELLRFLMVRTKASQHIDFDPEATHTIPKLFDDFDEARLSKNNDLKRIYQLSVLEGEKDYFAPHFSDLLNIAQMPNIDIDKWAKQQKGSPLSTLEIEKLNQRLDCVKIYLKEFAPDEIKFDIKDTLPESAKNLGENQKKLLTGIIKLLPGAVDPEKFQNDIYQEGKKLGLSSGETFQAIYLPLLGKKYGPKAAWLLLSLDKQYVINRFEEVTI